MSKGFIDLEINNKKYKVPTSWDSLTLEQYCKIFRNLPIINEDDDDDVSRYRRVCENGAMILSRILGENDEFCLDLPINVYKKLNEIIKFIYDIDFLKKSSKAGLVIDGKHYSVPPFNEMSLRQFIDADVVMQDKDNPLQYIELLAVLLTEKDKKGKWIPYDGNYEELMGKLRVSRCSDSIGIVYHFFKKGEVLKKLSEVSMKVEQEKQRLQHTANS